jgi:putative sterol carrier protein
MLILWLAGAWLCVVALVCLAAGNADAQGADETRTELEAWFGSLSSRWPAGEMKDRSGTVVLRLSGDGGGTWHVRLAEGTIAAGAGEAPDPTAVIDSSAADWLAVTRGELPLVGAFFSGKMRVSGNLDFAREVYARLLPAARTRAAVTTDTTGWYAFKPLPIDYTAKVAADASSLLDPPAGKHGFLTIRGEHFAFQDGTPTRFWGVNIVSDDIFPDHKTARRVAARLSRFGCNMVRFHGADVDTGIFDRSSDDTQHFSAEHLERMDYLVYELKRHGIYVDLGLLVFRNFRAGDGVSDWRQINSEFIAGAKIACHFDRRLIELQKKYARELYTHRNKYTGLRYCDDPAIAMSEIINESSIFWAEAYDRLPAFYIAEINGLYSDWAKARGVESAAQVSVPQGLRRRDPNVLQFLYDTQVAYFTEMRDCLRSAGVKVPLAGSNFWEAMPLDLKSNLVLDYVDRHGYWDHPQSGLSTGAGFDNQPMVKSKGWNLITWISGQRAARKPLVVSEWNLCWINEYIAEGPLTMAAYGAFQGWDGLLAYSYSGTDWADRLEGEVRDGSAPQVFNIGCKPHFFASWPAAARLFLRGHVRAGRPLAIERRAGQVENIGQDLVLNRTAVRRRLTYAFATAGSTAGAPRLPSAAGPPVSDTGELRWDANAGLITVNASASAARIGFAAGPVQVGSARFEVTPEFAVVAVTALDDKPISKSRHLLITATARAENTGMVYGPGKTRAINAGRAPILMQPVRGTVRLVFAERPVAVEVYALDSIGRRQGTAAIIRQGAAATIPLAADAFWYEVAVRGRR